MTMSDASGLAGYQLHLPSFEGPLDVLLHLIERERLDISDLSLVAVTDGFLAYVAGLGDAPPALLADFAGIAARLLVLKSRSLLPRPAAEEQEADVDDLAEQLLRYQQAKLAAARLREAERAEWRSFVRPERADLPPPNVTLVAPPLAHLRRALVRTIARMRPQPRHASLRPVVTIGEMIGRVRTLLTRALHPFRFQDLTHGRGRDETIAGFLAVLTLWRRGEIHVTQRDLFGEIFIAPGTAPAESAVLDD